MAEGRCASLARRLAVYVIADPDQTDRDLVEVVDLALSGGATAVQLRAKGVTDRHAFELGTAISARCKNQGAIFAVNDRLDLALALGADGVHLGVDDLPLEVARGLVGADWVIGYSPETDEQARTAAARGASYLGVGPVFGTGSKPDAGSAIGLDVLRHRVAIAGIPVVGIGGIQADNAAQVIAAGAVGIAVVGAVLRAGDPASATRALAEAVHAAVPARIGFS